MEKNLRKPRKPESSDERANRLNSEVERRREEDAAEGDRMDEMVRLSIELRGS